MMHYTKLTFNKWVESSETLAPEWGKAGQVLLDKWRQGEERNNLELKRALICFTKEKNIRLYHIDIHPLSTEMDLADANCKIAMVHLAYVSSRNSNTQSLADHRAAGANCIFAAWKLRKKVLGADHSCTRATWTQFENVGRH